MRQFLLVCLGLTALACSAGHEPLVIGGTGGGVEATHIGGGLKWDGRGVVRFTGDTFEITNLDSEDWERVTLSVNYEYSDSVSDAGYVLEVERMKAGETYTAPCSLFKRDGRRYDPTTDPPQDFSIKAHHDGDKDGKTGGFSATWR